MKKMLLILLVCCTFTLSGCTTNTSGSNNNEVQVLEDKIKVLEAELEEKNDYIESIEEKENLFPTFSNIAIEFVRGQTQGDIQKLKEVISDNVIILEQDNKIYGVYESNGQEIEYQLYSKTRDAVYKDMIIQGYGYLEESDTYVIHIREFFEHENGESVIPPTFLDLYFKNISGSWKIVSFEFDI